jgi:hypothetical protein
MPSRAKAYFFRWYKIIILYRWIRKSPPLKYLSKKPQEIKSQGNSSIVNNIKDNNGVIHNHNHNTTFINTILNNTTFINIIFINIIFNNTPTLPVFNLGKKVYDAFESNACVALEIIHLSNNVLYDFAKTNPRTYEFLTNTLEEDFFKSSCTK